MENLLILWITAYFLVAFFIHILKIKRFDTICMIYALWIVSSFAGYIYANSTLLYQGKGEITAMSIIFLILMYHITMSPLNNIGTLTKNNYVVEKGSILTISTYILAILPILPFVENVLHIGNIDAMNALGEAYSDKDIIANFDPRAHMSWLGARLNSLTLFSKYITPFLLMHYLTTSQVKNKLVVIGLVMGVFNPAIFMFNYGSRWVVIEDILFIIFLILFYYDILPKKILKVTLIIISLVGFFLVLCVGYITLGRFSETDNTIMEWLCRYAGEGFYNFPADLWYVNNHSDGMHIFRYFYNHPINQLNHIMGVRMYVFYTYIGDLFADYGLFFTIIICLIMNAYIKKLVNKKRRSLFNIFLISMYCKILLTGYTYIIFMNTIISAFIAYIFFLIYNTYEKNINKKR